MAEIEVRTDSVGTRDGSGARRQGPATQNETAKKAREQLRLRRRKRLGSRPRKGRRSRAEAQRLAAEAKRKRKMRPLLSAACVRGRNSRREIDAQKRAATSLAACERGRSAEKTSRTRRPRRRPYRPKSMVGTRAELRAEEGRDGSAAAERGGVRKEVKEQQHAATALQAQIKGRNARKEVADQKVAATKWQAHRGKMQEGRSDRRPSAQAFRRCSTGGKRAC